MENKMITTFLFITVSAILQLATSAPAEVDLSGSLGAASQTGLDYINGATGNLQGAAQYAQNSAAQAKAAASNLYGQTAAEYANEIASGNGLSTVTDYITKLTAMNRILANTAAGSLKKKLEMEAAVLDQIAQITKALAVNGGAGIETVFNTAGGLAKSGVQMPLNLAANGMGYMANGKRTAGSSIANLVDTTSRKVEGYVNSSAKQGVGAVSSGVKTGSKMVSSAAGSGLGAAQSGASAALSLGGGGLSFGI